MKTITIVSILLGITIVLILGAHRDNAVNSQADKYTYCVEMTYHESPAEYYAVAGQYPTCK